jgi:hypothetical protein
MGLSRRVAQAGSHEGKYGPDSRSLFGASGIYSMTPADHDGTDQRSLMATGSF